jgi:3-oxoacyl-[acyl-carrier-protein] synthase-3
MSVLRAVPLGCGHYLPARVVENEEFARTLDTSDEWIRSRTGIERRHFAAEGEATSDLAIASARAALVDAGLDGTDIDAVILATATPDQTFPSTAVKVQSAIGMRNGFAFDIQAVCAGCWPRAPSRSSSSGSSDGM